MYQKNFSSFSNYKEVNVDSSITILFTNFEMYNIDLVADAFKINKKVMIRNLILSVVIDSSSLKYTNLLLRKFPKGVKNV